MGKKILSFFNNGKKRNLSGAENMIVTLIAFAAGCFAIYGNAIGYIDFTLQMHVFYGVLLALAFLTNTPVASANREKIPWYDWVMAAAALVSTAYYVLNFRYFNTRSPIIDKLSTLDMVMTVALILLSIEAVRRVLGRTMLLVTLLFFFYALFGVYLPGSLRHNVKGFMRVVDTLIYTGSGVFNSSMQVVGSYVFLFTLFGVLFALSGAGAYFNDVAICGAGRSRGGPAKISVIASALFGSISGSPSANVITTGSVTIPLMRKYDYNNVDSGAIVAVAASGGAILPPMMGTAALLMVEMAGIPYIDICLAAAVPALLYYGSVFFNVHIHAKKTGIGYMGQDAMPTAKRIFRDSYFFLPLVLIVVLLALGWTTSRTASLACLAVIVCSWVKKDTRLGPKAIFNAIADGVRSVSLIGVSCFSIGCVITGLVATGKSGQLTSLIFRIGGSNILMALFITAVLVILLGMGMPIAPAYMLAAVFTVPTLIKLGLSTMAAHLFTVYFATFSAITPPVAVAAFAAASIADADASKIGWKAVKVGIAAFIVPFAFAINPELLSYEIGSLSYWITILSCSFAMMLTTLAVEGYWEKTIPWWLRVIFAVVAVVIMFELSQIADIVGAIAMAAIVVFCVVRAIIKKQKKQPQQA